MNKIDIERTVSIIFKIWYIVCLVGGGAAVYFITPFTVVTLLVCCICALGILAGMIWFTIIFQQGRAKEDFEDQQLEPAPVASITLVEVVGHSEEIVGRYNDNLMFEWVETKRHDGEVNRFHFYCAFLPNLDLTALVLSNQEKKFALIDSAVYSRDL